MDIARCLDTIDRLCLRPFPARHAWSDVGRAGPGYFMAELHTGEGEETHGERTADDAEACKEAVAQRLHRRWGPVPAWGMLTLRVRGLRGEEIPEPWASLSHLTDEAYVWQADGTGRWVAVAVADRDPADAIRLLAVVTDTDPP
ncbi:hypothetical protein [Streptomyces sp. JB150]|uniref:hypothetical protein n=1 Tax=Streptomyces sp. JB150 TaxID=2714844 RepID=UPI00140CDB88|nr:hypothetical protein [Streptomyces sp. JB150]QIJ61351.1 hypothetical protein G7Z13_04370 [Streptomyces sp. JB150]